jgi:hypothetical protein
VAAVHGDGGSSERLRDQNWSDVADGRCQMLFGPDQKARLLRDY